MIRSAQVCIKGSLEVKLIIIFYLNKVKMEITQSFANAGYQKHDKNIETKASYCPLPQNQSFSVWDTMQQNQVRIVLSSIGPSELNSQFYQIKSNLLVGTKITELARAKLRAWIYEETARLKASRQLCGYACTYVDLYLSKKLAIRLEQFQNFGMGCLVLANKLTDNIEMKIDHSVFPKKEITLWEQRVCVALQFRLSPITYHTILGWVVLTWNIFAQKNNLWIFNTGCIENHKLSDITKMFDILDFLALSSQSVSYNKGVLQLQVFKVVNRMIFDTIKQEQCMSIQDEVLISFWSNPEEESLLKCSFQTLCHKFEQYAKVVQPWINKSNQDDRKSAQNWIYAILSQFPELVDLAKNQTPNKKIWVQTINENWYSSMKKISKSQKANSHRKASIQTTI